MAIFKVTEPKIPFWKQFFFYFIRVVCPLILIWDLVQFIVNKYTATLIIDLIVPSVEWARNIRNNGGRSKACDEISKNFPSFTLNTHEIETHDNALLDTLELIHPEQATQPIHEQKYVVYFGGNGELAFSMRKDHLQDAIKDNYNLVYFDYRGSVDTKVMLKSANDLVVDGIAQVQRLLDQGVSSKNIVLCGQSLGGAVCAHVGQYFHANQQPISIFNQRSFSSLTHFCVGWIHKYFPSKENPHKPSFWGKLCGFLATPFIWLVLQLTKWELNAAGAYKSIPQAYRQHAVVWPKEDTQEGDDEVIPHYASMHAALLMEDQREEAKFQPPSSVESRHNCPTQALSNKAGVSLKSLFSAYVNRVFHQSGSAAQASPESGMYGVSEPLSTR